MVHLVRPVYHSIIDVFIGQSEEISYCYNQFLEGSPYSFRNRQLQRIFGSSLKEFAHRLVGCKPLYKRKNVILQRSQRRRSNLRSKVVGLALAQAQQPFGFFKHDFQGPSLGINSICFEEVKLGICGYQATPNTVLTSLNKEQTYFGICKKHVCYDIMAAQLSTVPTLFLPGKMFDQGGCSIEVMSKAILCLSVIIPR